jgi:hypothetical protein
MSAWRIPMTTEPSCIEILVSWDDRLLAAVDTALLHACERAGLSSRECSDLSGAITEICIETFGLANHSGTRDTVLRLLICDFEARVEVTIERSDGGPVAPAEGVKPVANVDRVSHETHNSRPRTVVVKHHAATHPHR